MSLKTLYLTFLPSGVGGLQEKALLCHERKADRSQI